MSVAELGIVLFAAPAGQAVWSGVRLELASFGADVAAAGFDAIRAALRVPRRERVEIVEAPTSASSDSRPSPERCRRTCRSCDR